MDVDDHTGGPDTSTDDRPRLSPAKVLLFAVACGLSVANVYAAQPLLDAIAADLHIGVGTVGLVVTLTQIGYALGLFFLVPLGDLVDRRRLIVGQAVLSAAALVVVGFAPTAGVLLVAMAIVGLLAVVVQVLVAFASTLAPPAQRGQVVGSVTSGVVIGILAARFVAGALADLGGWRSVYLTSAGLVLLAAGVLYRALPQDRQKPDVTSYAALLRSTAALFVELPILRLRAAFAFLIFATFGTFWTSIVLPLSAPPLSLSHTKIGLLGLVGVAGALAARGAGRLADRGLGRATTGGALALMLMSWLPIAFLYHSFVALVVGVILLDLAVQAVHVTNQTLIFAARPEAQSRLVGGYMVFYSAGSALGAIASTSVYAYAGWAGVCGLGTGLSAAALLLWLATLRRPALNA